MRDKRQWITTSIKFIRKRELHIFLPTVHVYQVVQESLKLSLCASYCLYTIYSTDLYCICLTVKSNGGYKTSNSNLP